MRADIERFQHEGWISISYGLLATTLFWAGRWVEAELAWREPIQREPPGVLQGGVQALLMTARAYRSTPGALDELQTIASDLPSGDAEHRIGVWIQIAALVEGFCDTGPSRRCGRPLPYRASGSRDRRHHRVRKPATLADAGRHGRRRRTAVDGRRGSLRDRPSTGAHATAQNRPARGASSCRARGSPSTP